jgi:hypothetical protein
MDQFEVSHNERISVKAAPIENEVVRATMGLESDGLLREREAQSGGAISLMKEPTPGSRSLLIR